MVQDDLSRIAIVGTSCSGKTTLARQIAELLRLEHIERNYRQSLASEALDQRPVVELRTQKASDQFVAQCRMMTG